MESTDKDFIGLRIPDDIKLAIMALKLKSRKEGNKINLPQLYAQTIEKGFNSLGESSPAFENINHDISTKTAIEINSKTLQKIKELKASLNLKRLKLDKEPLKRIEDICIFLLRFQLLPHTIQLVRAKH